MFRKLNPFATSAAIGVTVRYATVIISTALTIFGLLGWLDAAQVEALKNAVPELVGAVSGLVAVIIPIYAVLTKSHSDKAAAVAKTVDAELPKAAPVVIRTSDGVPDIVVADKSGR